MREHASKKSTNVRVHWPGALGLLAFGAWVALAAAMQWSGALATLESDVAWIAAFAAAFSALACAVDEDLRQALENLRRAQTLTGLIASIAACAAHPAALLAFSPAAVFFAVALARRWRGSVSSTAAASPAARRGAL